MRYGIRERVVWEYDLMLVNRLVAKISFISSNLLTLHRAEVPIGGLSVDGISFSD